MAKQYMQTAYRVTDGDFMFHHITITERPSGLLIPVHINTVGVTSPVSTAELAHDAGISYDQPPPSGDKIKPVREDTKVARLSVDASAPRLFIEQGVSAVLAAFNMLIAKDASPTVVFESTQELSSVDPSDRQVMESFAATLNNKVNGNTPLTEESNTGQYL